MEGLKKNLVYRFGGSHEPQRLVEQLFLKNEKKTPIVYIWAGLSPEIFEAFHELGSRIIIERINCHRHTAKESIETASNLWNIPIENTITEKSIAIENRKLELADAIFCPSPMVLQSMLENNIAPDKLLSTSYGWAPERFPNLNPDTRNATKPVFLFAGTICLRKGIPLLLEAWKRAALDAELVLCGSIAPEIHQHLPQFQNIRNIRHVAYTRDIGTLYRNADIFVFPSLEEGGPMVTYEAMAHGLPPLVTDMGAGAIVENGKSGTILPNADPDAWAQAMTLMAQNAVLRREIGIVAQERAKKFTWKQVAEQRAQLLEARYPELWNQQEKP
ncbi:glycosyltransferase family 4 protein [Chlorobium sp.]|uniref:glycosyltransferase family 4 protein n=1 Tax=Chlorobium sp. TaxID=1095 RepID=UPI0025C404DA|nr:glycosyltransferase family 4 protein [Chlorobium sp.]